MRLAPRAAVAAAVILTACVGSFGPSLSHAPAAAAPGGDGRGATHVHETPQPPAAEGERVVSLTFDDGPHPRYTPAILDVLARQGVKATFFLLGSEAERHPDLVRRIVAEGHTVANHTWTHPDLRTLDEEAFADEIDRTNDVLETITGERISCARPPFGRADATVQRRLAARGMTSVVWTADSRDFQKPGADAIVASALDGIQPGGVILLHDGGGAREQTIAALPRIIEGIRAAGYRMSPICAPDPHAPIGGLLEGRPRTGRISVVGWAEDPDTDDPIEVHLYLDGAFARSTRADTPVEERDEPGPRYRTEVPARPGPHEVCAFAINVGPGRGNPRLGCTPVEVGPLTAFDDLRPLAARVRFVQLVAQAQAVRDVTYAHEVRRRPWTLDGVGLLARPHASG